MNQQRTEGRLDSPKKRKIFHENDNEHLKIEIDTYVKQQIAYLNAQYMGHITALTNEVAVLKLKVEALENRQQSVVQNNNTETVQCIICLDDCVDPSILIPCGHTYCTKCIGLWLQENIVCPTCRTNVERCQKIFV
jgi:hypothetical protein